MADKGDLVEELKRICADLPGQSVEAAHYLINNFDEVAFNSMREIARRAEVPPVSFVRLAQRLGLSGYSELRQRAIEALRRQEKRDQLSTTRNQRSARSLIGKMDKNPGLETFVDSFFEDEADVVRQAGAHLSKERLKEAVALLARASKVYVFGRRTAFTPAFTLAYTLRKARPNVILVDGPGGAPEAGLEDVSKNDVFVATTFAPFNRLVYQLAKKAAASGARVIAITDSFASPVGKLAGELHFVVRSSGQAFPESALGAIAVANLLSALTISRLGEAAQKRIRANERFLVGSGEYLFNGKGTRRGLPP